MSQQNCSPNNIFDPGQNQTLFLGCSVSSFTSSVSWGNDSSELTVNLVEDDCGTDASSPKVYWDGYLQSGSTTGADPGFLGSQSGADIIGCLAYFRFGDFEYTGLISSWEQQNSTSGKPTYQVKLMSPSAILESTQLILSQYDGSTSNVYNLINVFGYMEAFGGSCPQYYQSAPGVYSAGDGGSDGATFGTLSQGYGGAGVNSNGIQESVVRDGINLLLNQIPKEVNQFSSYGRVIYRGPINASGYGLLQPDASGYCEYFVDISELPTTPSYYRFNDFSISLLDYINQVTNDAGFDYYIETVPVTGVNTLFAPSTVAKFIKVRTVDRGTQPSFGAISSFVGDSGNGVISNSAGQENRNEIMSSVLVGGSKQTVYQAENATNPDGGADGTITQGGISQTGCLEIDDTILPYFGLDQNNDLIVPCKDGDGFWYFTVDSSLMNLQLEVLSLPSNTTINEKELLFAISGYDEWLAYVGNSRHTADPTSTSEALPDTAIGKFDWEVLGAIFGRGDVDKLAGDDFVNTRITSLTGLKSGEEAIDEDISLIYEWVRKYASEFYGRKFAVRVPFTCVAQDSESGQFTYSEKPTQDGGWTEVTPIIGLPNGTAFMDFFRNDQQKIETFVRIDDASGTGVGSLDISVLNPDDYGVYNSGLFLRASVEEDYVFHDYSSFFGPRAIVTIPQPINRVQERPKSIKMLHEVLEFVFNITDADAEKALNEHVAGKVVFGPMEHRAEIIDAAAFGMKSNILSYGPWVNVGEPGQTKIVREEGLVPWEYGGYTTLNLAGQAMADMGLTAMQVAEMGNVTVAGYPKLPLGAELGALAGGYFGAGAHLVENRTLNSGSYSGDHITSGSGYTVNYGFFNYSGSWSGVYGPNITNITTQIGAEGVTTTYNLRTFTPKFGRFSKSTINRMREIGQLRNKIGREIRGFNLQRAQRQLFGQREAAKREWRQGRAKAPGTPHAVLVGQIIDTPDGTYKRPIMASEAITELDNELSNGYDNKAIMSLDGLFRPVSMDGDGGLPQYVKPTGTGAPLSSSSAQSPVMVGDGNCGISDSTEYYNLTIDTDYLNPWSNPSGFERSSLNDRAESYVGHDINILARTGEGSGNTPESGLIMPVAGDQEEHKSDYTDDYRGIAWKGPIMIQAWGYDTNGKPIPNAADTEVAASGGEFVHTNLKDKFYDDWMRNPHIWPVAPLDLRFDRLRGVWTTAQDFTFMSGELCEDFDSGGSGLVEYDHREIYDSGGTTITTPVAYAFDPYDLHVPSGAKLLTKYDRDLEKHIIYDRVLYKPNVRFTLDAALATTDASGNATITDQYGYGVDAGNTSINILNTETSTGGTYIFEGSSGNAGIASWHSGNHYLILNMECSS